MLHRGRIVCNKKQRIYLGGAKAKRACPETEWLVLDAPKLLHGRLIFEPFED